MDLETENRIAAILMKEAAELRRQAQSKGALAYLRRPTIRSRPNSRFLTATVRGVQQANRAVEVNEMWRLREKQIELDNKGRNESRGRSCKDISESHRSGHKENIDMETSASTSTESNKRNAERCYTIEDEGLRDDEVDEFLHSRTKRGRGAVGSRMDETGPYPSLNTDSEINASGNSDNEWKKPRPVLGLEKPYSLKPRESSSSSDDDESSEYERRSIKKTSSGRQHSRKYKSKEKNEKSEKEKNKKRNRHHHQYK